MCCCLCIDLLILLIRSHCKICTISRVCIVGNCWQWANFTKGPNEQNQHFAELRQKLHVRLYIHEVVLLRFLPSLDIKLECFVTKNGKSGCQTRVRQTIGAARGCQWLGRLMTMYTQNSPLVGSLREKGG